MIGYLRLFLALLVLISHTDVRINGLNEGVIAVIIFYILAGHVITYIFSEIFSYYELKKRFFIFYFERVLRIFPLYTFVVLITYLFLKLTNYGQPEFSPINIALNLLIVPLNYYMYIEEHIIILRATEPAWWFVPPAWSLGAEIQAYLLLPFLIVFRKLGAVIFLVSFLIYCLSNLNVLHSDYFGYRLIPGVMFIFLLGVYVERAIKNTLKLFEAFILIFSYTLAIIWFFYFVILRKTHGIYTRETLIGIIIGVPLVYLLLKLKYKPPFYRLMGSLSYGIFLSHFLAIWLIDFLDLNLMGLYFYSAVVLTSLLISILGVILIDKPFEKFRFKLSRNIYGKYRNKLKSKLRTALKKENLKL